MRDDSIELAFKFDAAHALVNLAMLGEDAWTLNVISYREALGLVVWVHSRRLKKIVNFSLG